MEGQLFLFFCVLFHMTSSQKEKHWHPHCSATEDLRRLKDGLLPAICNCQIMSGQIAHVLHSMLRLFISLIAMVEIRLEMGKKFPQLRCFHREGYFLCPPSTEILTFPCLWQWGAWGFSLLGSSKHRIFCFSKNSEVLKLHLHFS